MYKYFFKWKIVEKFNDILSYLENLYKLDNRILLSEFDLQCEIVNYFRQNRRNLKNEFGLGWKEISFFNCFYIGYKETNIKKIYPDLLLFINDELAIIIELKFFRRGRPFIRDELKKDLTKIERLLKWLNDDIKEPIDKVLGMEFIIDFTRNHINEIFDLLSEFPSYIFYKECDKEEIYHSIVFYKYIPAIENQFVYREIDRIRNQIKLKSSKD